MARRKKGKQPQVGDRVRFVLWYDDKEVREGYVTQLLSTQFMLLTDDGYTHYKFYSDYGDEWKIIPKPNGDG